MSFLSSKSKILMILILFHVLVNNKINLLINHLIKLLFNIITFTNYNQCKISKRTTKKIFWLSSKRYLILCWIQIEVNIINKVPKLHSEIAFITLLGSSSKKINGDLKFHVNASTKIQSFCYLSREKNLESSMDYVRVISK